MGIRTEIRGIDTIPQNSAGILAAKHASNYDAVLAWQLRPRVTAFAKKELFKIPFLGLMFNKIGVVKVDRGSGKSFDDMKKVADFLEETNNLLIVFPEATRVKPGVRKKLKSGAFHLYNEHNIPVYPVATNTGQLWRKGFWHRSGTIIYEVGEALPTGLDKKAFMQAMHEKIILRSDEIMREQGLDLPPYEDQIIYSKKGR